MSIQVSAGALAGKMPRKPGAWASVHHKVDRVIVKTLHVSVGDAYTLEVAEAYTALWSVVEATMLSGYDYDEWTASSSLSQWQEALSGF